MSLSILESYRGAAPQVPMSRCVQWARGVCSQNADQCSQWFRAPNCFPGHTCNAYEDESGNIVFDLALSTKNVFFWWPDRFGKAPRPEEISSELLRYTFDGRSSDLELPKPDMLMKHNCEFPRIDERVSGRKHSHAYLNVLDPSLGTNFEALSRVMGGGFAPYNSIGHYDYKADQVDLYFPGKMHMVQEPVFTQRSRSASEGDGFVMALVNNYELMTSELHIIDTQDFTKAVAVVHLPVRLRAGLHGNWIDASDMA